jgi:hypothetical protein
MNAFRKSLALVMTLAAAACSQAPVVRRDALEPGEREAMSARTVLVVRHPLPSFQINTAADQYLQVASASLGLPGIWGTQAGIMMLANQRGDPLVRDDQLTDPANGVAAGLGRNFGPRFGVVYAGLTDEIAETRDAKELAGSLKGRADFALDLWTANWGLYSSLFHPAYRFGYAGVMRVIDIETGAVLASGRCGYWPDSSEAERMDDLTSEHAARLKVKISQAIETCTAQFTEIILNRPDTKPRARDRPATPSR